MQTVYMHETDRSRACEVEYIVKRSGRVPGRVGLSLLTRVGLHLLEREMDEHKARTLDLIA